MKYLTFKTPEQNKYPVALLVKYLRAIELRDYVQGIEGDVVAYQIPNTKNPKNPEIKEFLSRLLPTLCNLRVEYVMVTDASYFKVLTKAPRVDRIAGYVMPCVIEGFEHLNILYVPAPGTLIYDPSQKGKLDQGLRAMYAHRTGSYQPPGASIIQFAEYPQTVPEIATWLEKLLDVPLAIDIEAYSLKHYSAGIGTICMAWSQHEGIAFSVDKDRDAAESRQIRELLLRWFEARTARTLYHRAWYDVYILVYQLFMRDVLDNAGKLYGLEVMLRHWDDTQLIRYLATNSCAGNKLSLKDVAQEFAGNYAVEVNDIRTVPLPQLLEYNLIDGLSTWYAFNKHFDQMVADKQLPIYIELFKPCMHDIIQMQLTGLPVDMEEVKRGKAEMQGHQDVAVKTVMDSRFAYEVMKWNAEKWARKQNEKLKVKRVTLNDCPKDVYELNLNSPLQLQYMLHELMKLPILKETDTGQPQTGMDAVEALINHTNDPEAKKVLAALIDYKQVNKILTSFIPAFENAYLAPDGWYYLFGNFNLGGTLSGRLSSSDPNLQNLPATGSKYRKLIKKMFKAPPGKLLVGLDFASLEDRISALTTKDPNKLKVYTDGYDGHCLRAFAYFREDMPDIIDTLDSINSIAKQYPDLRQKSKTPTFALTYQGTVNTLVNNEGFSRELAQQIYDRYHELYVVSDAWVQDKLKQAQKDGYVTLAFGLRLRTPMMKQCVMGTRSTPYEAVAEGRSAGNALGQSWCMLNSRAGMAFMREVRKSKYRLDIQPCAQIHDAQYYIVDNDAELLAWMNVHLVREVFWQNDPEIQHPDVKLGGELSVFYPTWANELTIPNGADEDQILQLAQAHIANVKLAA